MTELETCERCTQLTVPEWGGSEWTRTGYLNFDILCHDCFTTLGGQTHD